MPGMFRFAMNFIFMRVSCSLGHVIKDQHRKIKERLVCCHLHWAGEIETRYYFSLTTFQKQELSIGRNYKHVTSYTRKHKEWTNRQMLSTSSIWLIDLFWIINVLVDIYLFYPCLLGSRLRSKKLLCFFVHYNSFFSNYELQCTWQGKSNEEPSG